MCVRYRAQNADLRRSSLSRMAASNRYLHLRKLLRFTKYRAKDTFWRKGGRREEVTSVNPTHTGDDRGHAYQEAGAKELWATLSSTS